MSDATVREALDAAEDSLTQARADVWQAVDALVQTDPQAAADLLIRELGRTIEPLAGAVLRLGGDPRRCWPEHRRGSRRGQPARRDLGVGRNS